MMRYIPPDPEKVRRAQEEHDYRRRTFTPGTRVVLEEWAPPSKSLLEAVPNFNEYDNVPRGTEGTVTELGVTGFGDIAVQWDNGSRLNVTLGDRVAVTSSPPERHRQEEPDG